MKYVQLGQTGARVSRLAIGTATFGVAPLARDADALIGRAFDLGINVIDTSNSYGHQPRFDRAGAPPAAERLPAEEIVGNALRGRRSSFVLCTKVMEPVGPGVNDRGLSRVHIMQQVEESLRRLQTDYIDVYYAHHPDPTTPIEQTLRAFDDLIRQGKVRYCALSTYPGWQIVEALWCAEKLNLNPPVALQARYNLVDRGVERDAVAACQRFGLTIMAFSPLAGGLLTGLDILERPVSGSARWGGPAFSEEQIEYARRLAQLSRESGLPAAQLALAWLLAQPAVSSAIVGPENLSELEATAAAADLELEPDLLQRLAAIA